MVRILVFSTYFKPLFNWLKLGAVVLFRVFPILFRKNMRIQLVRLDYATKHVFANGYASVEFVFRNALWYKVLPAGLVTTASSLLINTAVAGSQISLVVYGLFQRKVYLIDLTPQHQLVSDYFRIDHLKKCDIVLSNRELQLVKNLPKTNIPAFSCQQLKISISHNPFNKNDFL